SSPFRRQLLERLQLPFSVESPEIDESPLPLESPHALVLRLAEAKARAVARKHAAALIIGSDQAAVLHNEILGKPGNRKNAVMQLEKCNGKKLSFHTGLCLLDSSSGQMQLDDVVIEVKFRTLTTAQIERYIDIDQPFNCAGSFKSEGLGISLLEYMHGDDPTALIGLPLIRLTDMLIGCGLKLP
ncbi:MAG TPA: Maf family nucleotide pyrophosphatase, partial [Gammaproteobacteria bacterium]